MVQVCGKSNADDFIQAKIAKIVCTFKNDKLLELLFSFPEVYFIFAKPLSMGSVLMERIFRSTPNGVLTAHTEWLPGV